MTRAALVSALAVCLALGGPATAQTALGRLSTQVNAPSARDAIARVAYAEAAGQGDAGLAGVVFTILNRVASGEWGSTVEAVVNARAQFEPVLRVGGDWRGLPATTAAERARIDTILNLALAGRLPDPTGGARYFQNPEVVAARARAGAVRPSLVHFGGATPSAIIGDHAFYVSTARFASGRSSDPYLDAGGDVFAASPAQEPSRAGTPIHRERGLFVLADGEIIEDLATRSAP